MKKKLLLILFCIFSISIFAQEIEEISEENTVNIKGEEYREAESFLDFIHSLDFVMQFEPGMYINNYTSDSEGKLISGPSPVIYPISLGVLWPNYTFIAIQPTLSFFTMEHLYYNGMALPAEIENRTTTTLSFMVNMPLVFSLFVKQTRFQLSGGIGGLLQFGMRSAGVESNDYGYSGSAENDTQLINQYFWKDLHWLYLTTGASFLYNVNSQLRVGPTFNTYIPLGTLMGNQNLHGFMFSLGVKICR